MPSNTSKNLKTLDNSFFVRLENKNISGTEAYCRETFINWIKTANYEHDKVLSISVGDGIWDYLALKNNQTIQNITATDIINNPIQKNDLKVIKQLGKWEFVKVKAENTLPFKNNIFKLIYHFDVIEHVQKPHLFLAEQYRVLKKGGELIFGTPNLLRVANIFSLLQGKLYFPKNIGHDARIGDYIHMHEFTENNLQIMLSEIGFKKIESKPLFFGIHPLNITFVKYPKSGISRSLCNYHIFRCQK